MRSRRAGRNKCSEQPAHRREGRLAQDRRAPKRLLAPIPRVSAGMTGPALLAHRGGSRKHFRGGASRGGMAWMSNRGDPARGARTGGRKSPGIQQVKPALSGRRSRCRMRPRLPRWAPRRPRFPPVCCRYDRSVGKSVMQVMQASGPLPWREGRSFFASCYRVYVLPFGGAVQRAAMLRS